MMKNDEWLSISLHCPYCGYIVKGYKGSGEKVKIECKRCKTLMFISKKVESA